ALDVCRCPDLDVQDQVLEVGAVVSDLVDYRLRERFTLFVGPVAALDLVWAVLDEAAHEVLSRRCHRRVGDGRDDHVDVRVLGPGAFLPVVVGAFHAFNGIDEMHVAVEQRVVLRQGGEGGHAVQGNVQLPGRATDLEVPDAPVELGWQVFFVHALQERALHVHPGYHDLRINLFAVRQCNPFDGTITNDDLPDPGIGPQFASVRLEGAGDRFRHRSHASARVTPGSDVAVDFTHVVVQQHVGRAGRMNAERRTDNAAARERGLDHVGLEIFVQVL